MKTIAATLTTTAVFSDDGKKRYLLTKIWDEKKPNLAIVMISPSEASSIELDHTTLRVINNSYRLGYGSVSIVNLFSVIGNFDSEYNKDIDKENAKVIEKVATEADIVVYAPGVGRITNKYFIRRQNQVLDILAPFENKLRCLTNEQGDARFQHPLSPSVSTWYLSEMKINELYRKISAVPVSTETIKKSKNSSSKAKKISSP